MKQAHALGVAFSGIAFVLLLLTMFLPMHAEEGNGGSAKTTVWGVQYEYSGFSGGGFSFEGGSGSNSWHDSDFDDEDGITQLRMSGPFMVVGLTLAFAGALVGLTANTKDLGNTGMLLLVFGTVFAATALILYEAGINAQGNGGSHGAGFGLAIAGICLTGVAALMYVVED